jgi:hypothetical protein
MILPWTTAFGTISKHKQGSKNKRMRMQQGLPDEHKQEKTTEMMVDTINSDDGNWRKRTNTTQKREHSKSHTQPLAAAYDKWDERNGWQREGVHQGLKNRVHKQESIFS